LEQIALFMLQLLVLLRIWYQEKEVFIRNKVSTNLLFL